MMRFHVIKNDDGEALDFYVRVLPPVARQKYSGPPQCKCGEVFPVIMQSVSREHVAQGACRDRQKYVCHCHGELAPYDTNNP